MSWRTVVLIGTVVVEHVLMELSCDTLPRPSGGTGSIWQLCIIHQQVLVTKEMSKELHVVLEEAVKVVNLIRSAGVNARLFSILCSQMVAHCQHLLLRTEVWGLSRGNVLTRWSSFQEEVLLVPAGNQLPSSEAHGGHELVAVTASLSDIFEQMITLNISLQDKQGHVFVAHHQVSASRKQLDLLFSC